MQCTGDAYICIEVFMGTHKKGAHTPTEQAPSLLGDQLSNAVSILEAQA